MKYWDDFHDKRGFGGGEAVPPDAWALRFVYVREINLIAARLGSNVRLFAYDRPGLHNPYLISRVAADTVSGVSGNALCKGLYRGGWDPGLNCAAADTDDALEAAIGAAMTMDLEDLVRVEVAIARRPRKQGNARRRAA
jgi:hypothetical protein